MLMEQEAPLLFHTVFAGAVILTVAYLLHWRSHSPQKKLYCCHTKHCGKGDVEPP